MTNKEHAYAARLVWEGNRGQGTTSYAGYGRNHRILIAGKPDLRATADASFRGEADTHNPEDLFLAAIASCHMLSYLALCARRALNVVAYEDDAAGTLRLDDTGGGRFTEVMLHPHVTVAREEDVALALALHEEAHRRCFIASSCAVPIAHEARVSVGRVS